MVYKGKGNMAIAGTTHTLGLQKDPTVLNCIRALKESSGTHYLQ